MIFVGRSKTNLPTITESGGGMTNTGSTTIVCGGNGEKLKPLFVPRGYSNGDHAIFVVKEGFNHLVNASRGKWGERATIERIISINDDDSIDLETVGEYENGDGNVPDQFEMAVKAALEKSRCYHCRESHFSL